jgi:GH24 family phage-related lysozyme (muramidase)
MGRTVQGNLGVRLKDSYFNITEAINGAINPETKMIDAASIPALQSHIATQKAELVNAISSATIPETMRKAQLERVEASFAGYEAQIAAQSKTGFFETMAKESEAVQSVMGTAFAPYYHYVKDTLKDDKLAEAYASMSMDQRITHFKANNPPEVVEALQQHAAYMSSVFTGKTRGNFQPNPAVPHVINQAGGEAVVKEAYQNDPGFDAKTYRQAKKFPVDTLEAINGGSVLVSAARGEAESQQYVVTSLNAVRDEILADMELGEGTGITARRKTGRGSGAGVTIDLPDHMEDRKDELSRAYNTIAKSRWMWPEGAVTPTDAFNAIINGEVPIATSQENLQDIERKSTGGQMARGRGKGGGSKISTDLPVGEGETERNRQSLEGRSDEELMKMSRSMGTSRVERNAAKAELQRRMSEPTDTIEVDPNKVYHGDEAVDVVEQLEGELSPIEEYTVREEGYQASDYQDTKGVTTSGVGQTGKYAGMTFKEAFAEHVKSANKKIPDLPNMPEEVQAALYSSWYRGMLTQSPETIKLINDGKYAEAADEFLDARDYRMSKAAGDGVAERMERVAEALRSLE